MCPNPQPSIPIGGHRLSRVFAADPPPIMAKYPADVPRAEKDPRERTWALLARHLTAVKS